MKTLRRVLAIGVVATVAPVGLATTTAGADHTEARLTLTIVPEIGPVGQTINAQLPAEAYDPAAGDLCAASATANQIIGDAFGDFSSGDPLEDVIAGILENATQEPSFEGTLDSILFPLVFADVATQEPLSDPSFWNPDNGQGSIVAPGEDVNTGQPLARPSTYAVAATCLGINPDLLPDAVAAAVEALTTLLEDEEGTAVTDLLTCLTAAGGDPAAIAACVVAFAETTATTLEEGVADVLAALLEATIDQDPDIAWAALFCLTGPNFETCEGPPAPGPAEPVAVTPRFTG
ncbi:MAG TPA: hypothetical protein VF152_15250 [Acidimicrobiia bacterium]